MLILLLASLLNAWIYQASCVRVLQVLVWDLKQQQGARASSGEGAAPGPDGLYAPLCAGTSAVNSVCLSTDTQCAVVGLESGHLSLFAIS